MSTGVSSVKKRLLSSAFWFLTGFTLAAFLLGSFVIAFVKKSYRDKVFPGVFIESFYVGGKGKEQIRKFFAQKNARIENNTFVFTYESLASSASARTLHLGYNTDLLSDQAFSIGRSGNPISDVYMIINSFLNGVKLQLSYTYSLHELHALLKPLQNHIYTAPTDALFTVTNNRVVAFRQSSEGKTIDFDVLHSMIEKQVPHIIANPSPKTLHMQLPITSLKPKIATEETNSLGIVEVVGEGVSYFSGSIPNRIHNITLAAANLNGILIPPGETLSFNDSLGDVSKFTGYKEAYIIKNGRTILGDGGGVCQVSTTLFRAVLNAGLPIVERHPHSYRVSYYEQRSPAGIDATVYAPSIDFKVQNDTTNYILIQGVVDPQKSTLSFLLYGKKDGRQVSLTNPVKTSEIRPAEPLYQDDPNLPKGTTKQVEFESWGATVSFGRTVVKESRVLSQDTFVSRYTPWQAVYLKGTKE